MAGAGATPTIAVADLSIQARLEQLEAAISDCHGAVSQITERGASDTAEAPAVGASDALDRCAREVNELHSRLVELTSKVGHL